MSTNRTRVKRGISALNDTSILHFLLGECFLCNCEICSGGHSQSVAAGRPAYQLNDDVLDIWQRHRGRILALWTDENEPLPGVSGFSAESARGGGRLGLPAWGQIKFEKAKLPKRDKSWPKDVLKAFETIKDNL
jgi:hypothetical protein